MVAHNPKDRLKIAQVLYHPTFFTAQSKLKQGVEPFQITVRVQV